MDNLVCNREITCRATASVADPVTSPVKFPTKVVAVTIPVATKPVLVVSSFVALS